MEDVLHAQTDTHVKGYKSNKQKYKMKLNIIRSQQLIIVN
jgi:hypothetical protein